MPKGYQSMILAVVGWLALAAAPAPDNAAQPKQSPAAEQAQNSLNAITATQNQITQTTNAGEYQQPCVEGQDNNNSDLCAQWYAARAARDAAEWAKWSVIVGIIGAVGIVAALLLTIDSNRIARDTARRQLRAYISVSEARIDLKLDDPMLHVVFKNLGQTPASHVRIRYYVRLKNYPLAGELEPYGNAESPSGEIGPGLAMHIRTSFGSAVTAEERAHVAAERAAFYFYGIVQYEDVFGSLRTTVFRLSCTGPDAFARGIFSYELEGNSST